MKSKLFLCCIGLVMALLAACDTSIPTPPPISINITAVDNTTALAQAVAEAVAATDQAHAHMTETVIANNGMTLTPSHTPTITPTPSATATRPVTATRTPTATQSLTPTYQPILTNTPAAAANRDYGWIRFLNSWVSTNAQASSVPVDVFVNEDRIARAVAFGSETNYYQVSPGAIRISLRTVNDSTNAADVPAPIVTTIVDVPPGGVVTVLAIDFGKGLNLYPVREDSSPISVGISRLTIVQANPALPTLDIDATTSRLRLASSINVGTVIGPLDLPAGEYALDLNDAKASSTTTLTSLPVNLTGQVSNILVLLPPSSLGTGSITRTLQSTGLTGRVENDLGIRFINALAAIGPIQLSVGQGVISDLGVSQVSPSVPVPVLGAPLTVSEEGDIITKLGEDVLGPYTGDADATADKIILLLPNEQANAAPYLMATFAQNAPRSAINASLRLIHGLPGAVPLNLQIRPLRALEPAVEGQPAQTPAWATVGQAEYGGASAYFSRNPEVYAVRVVQSGSQTVIAELPPQQFLAGGIYDFVVVPGAQTGSAQLLMVEPSIQITELVQGSANPTAIYEAVSGTLTAQAPAQVAVTVTSTFTATPSRTPVPTNTPRPTNTPEFRLPLLTVNPAPPNTAVDQINLVGENFQPKLQYVITLDTSNTPILTGQINDDGTLLATITLPENLDTGIHSLRVCVDCRPRGVQQAAYAQFIKADPRVTPTATAQP